LSIVLYMRSLLLVESFDLCPSNLYILMRVIPSCFRFAKMCLCQVSLPSRCSPRYLISSSWGSCTLFIWTGGGGERFSSCSECDVDRLESVSLRAAQMLSHLCASGPIRFPVSYMERSAIRKCQVSQHFHMSMGNDSLWDVKVT
jgi:hypothetical protein